MLQRELTREQVKQLGEQVLANMEAAIVERGYGYFSDGFVFNIRVEQNKLVSDVQGSQVYHVTIDLGSFASSSCTCPYARLCKHIAATFFQAYSVFENPRAFMNKLHEPRPLAFTSSILAPAYKSNPRARKNLAQPTVGGAALAPESSIGEWWQFLTKWTRNLPAAMEASRASTELFSSYENALGVASSWPDDLAQLFSVHATLFHLHLLQAFATDYRHSHWTGDLTQTAERLVEYLEGTLYDLDAERLWRDRRSHLQASYEKLKNWKHQDVTHLYGLLAYRLIWTELLTQPGWVDEELEALESCLRDPALPAAKREQYAWLRGHFSVLRREDDEALRVWLRSVRLPLSFYMPYLKEFARNQEWQRCLAWINRIGPLIGRSEASEYRLVSAIWREALISLNRMDEYGAGLKRFLPASYHDYAAHLYQQGEYRAWIDLQMTFQGLPLGAADQPKRERAIEEKEPHLLIPMLVRDINRLIEERNRTGYREAVKLLKKVRACFQKSNQQERWEQYIDRLAAKYSRLRAFQEELRRGNLHL